MPKLTTEKIAEIRRALQVIQEKIQLGVEGEDIGECMNDIFDQVARIDKLLPVVNFEGVK